MNRRFLVQRLLPRVIRLVEGAEKLFSRWSFTSSPLAASVSSGAHLFISHGRGGGAEYYVHKEMAKCRERGEVLLLLTFDVLRRRFCVEDRYFYSTQQLLNFLGAKGISHIHLHHVRYFPYVFVKALPEFAKALGANYDVTLHDFMSLCPRIHLIDKNWRYCGMPTDINVCQRCITQNGMLTSAPFSISAWRATWANILGKASNVFAPSTDTIRRHQAFFSTLSITPWHEEEPAILMDHAPSQPAHREQGQPLRIALVGHIYELKGADILVSCARDAQARKLPLQFTVIGNSRPRKSLQLQLLGVKVTGAYKRSDLPHLLSNSNIHAVFLASTCPETYSYALSEVWQYGYFPIAFDIGAPADRIRANGKGALLDVALMSDPSAINDTLLEMTA